MSATNHPLSGSTHAVVYESRKAECCGYHTTRWAICSCGWEADDRRSADLGAAVTGHRLSVIEKAVGIKFTFGAKP